MPEDAHHAITKSDRKVIVLGMVFAAVFCMNLFLLTDLVARVQKAKKESMYMMDRINTMQIALHEVQTELKNRSDTTAGETSHPIGDGSFYPSIQSAEDLYMPDGVVFRGPLDYGRSINPAIRSYGSLVVNGSVIISETLLLRIEDTLVNLTHFIITQQLQSQDLCTNPCPETGLREPLTCVCKCLPGWTGDDCSTPVCANSGIAIGKGCKCQEPYSSTTNCQTIDCGRHGYFDSVSQVGCVCDLGYFGAPCEPMSTTSSIDDCGCVSGQCINNKCICDEDGRMGAQCEYQCVDPRVSHWNSSECPFRSNLGERVDCFDTGAEIACICGGGGYVYEATNHFVSGVLKCESGTLLECQQQFDAERAACCSPGGRCEYLLSPDEVCSGTDTGCCVALSNMGMDICIANGCAFCQDRSSGITQCTSIDKKEAGCISHPVSTFYGDWVYYSYYSDLEQDRSESARSQYLDLYRPCIFEPIYSKCFVQAGAALERLPWPTLDVNSYTNGITDTPFTLFFPMSGTLLGIKTDKIRSLGAIDVVSLPRTTGKCQKNIAPLISKPVRVPPSPHTYHFFITTVVPGIRHCLAKTATMSPTTRLVLFGKTENIPAIVFAPTVTEGGVSIDERSICTPFMITKYAIYDSDGLGLNSDSITGDISITTLASSINIMQ